MAEPDLTLRDCWWVIRRRKWLVLLTPLLVGAAAYALAHLQAPAPLYQATAVARFERTLNVGTLLLRDFVSVSPVGDLETQAALVKSAPVLLRAARKLGRLSPDAAPEEVVRELGATIEVERGEGTSLIEITATAGDPETAARLANAVAEAFQENDLETRTRQVVDARRFIEAQLRDVGQRLRESEERLKAFQEANKVLLLHDEARTTLTRLADQEGEQERIRRELRAAAVQLRQLREAAPGDSAALVGTEGVDPTIGKLRGALSDLALERETLLLILRPEHPQARSVEARIANVQRELGEVVAAERARLVKALASRLEVLRAQDAQVTASVAALERKLATLPAVALEAARIEREVKVNERVFSLLRERLQEALIKEREQAAEVTVVRPALPPTEPVTGPDAASRGAVGLLVGALIGVALAFVVETLDTSIGAIQELESLLQTPVLGLIPYLDARAVAAENDPAGAGRDAEGVELSVFLPTVFAPTSPIAEAFRALRTNLIFTLLDRDVKTIMVASATRAEGKTTVAMNLAVALAQLGKRTLLIEADLRNPFIRRVFGIRRQPGLTNAVLGSTDLEEAALGFADLMLGKPGMEEILDAPGMDNFFVLPSGHRAPNPSELMSSRGLGALLARARELYDYVICDSAPALAVADAAILASQCDGILCVVRGGQVPRAALRRAKGILEGAKTPLLGVCLNGIRAEVVPDYHEMAYASYGYGPTHETPSTRPALGTLWPRPRHVLTRLAGVTALALALLTAGLWTLRPSVPVQVSEPAPAPQAAPAAAAPAASPPTAAATSEAARYSVELPAPAGGQLLIGDFPTPAEARAFGQDLVRDRLATEFRVVPAPPDAPAR